MTERVLEGQHVLVTGASRGIGAAVARRLAATGGRVSVIGRDRDRLEAVAAALAEARAIRCDVTEGAALETALAEAAGAFGPVAVLVNAAGAARSQPFLKASRADLEAMLAVNFTAAWRASQLLLPGMLAAGWGRIVTIASTAGLAGYPYVAAYCAAKHAVVGMTRALALEVASKGVTVNAVCPGYTDTDLLAGAVETISRTSGRGAAEVRRALARSNPQGRLLTPEEVADCVAWLAGPGAGGVNGQAIALDGGELAR